MTQQIAPLGQRKKAAGAGVGILVVLGVGVLAFTGRNGNGNGGGGGPSQPRGSIGGVTLSQRRGGVTVGASGLRARLSQAPMRQDVPKQRGGTLNVAVEWTNQTTDFQGDPIRWPFAIRVLVQGQGRVFASDPQASQFKEAGAQVTSRLNVDIPVDAPAGTYTVTVNLTADESDDQGNPTRGTGFVQIGSATAPDRMVVESAAGGCSVGSTVWWVLDDGNRIQGVIEEVLGGGRYMVRLVTGQVFDLLGQDLEDVNGELCDQGGNGGTTCPSPVQVPTMTGPASQWVLTSWLNSGNCTWITQPELHIIGGNISGVYTYDTPKEYVELLKQIKFWGGGGPVDQFIAEFEAVFPEWGLTP